MDVSARDRWVPGPEVPQARNPARRHGGDLWELRLEVPKGPSSPFPFVLDRLDGRNRGRLCDGHRMFAHAFGYQERKPLPGPESWDRDAGTAVPT